MAYTTTKIDRRNLVRLAGWGMTGLRPPGRGNLHDANVSALRAPESEASIVQAPVAAAKGNPAARA